MEEYLQVLLAAAVNCPVKWGYFEDGETMPLVSMSRMSGRRYHTLNSKGLMQGSIQIDCWGKTYRQAMIASREVRTSLEGFSGGPVVSARLTAARDSNSTDASAAHRVSLTFAITYRE
ncbi:DUF3168 domain-containing protein [Phaeobacter sp. JH20_36]|uniref:tail completion protein gp17 n=1 Tax=Phaeobacter TaxID=302485 RepID=UPI0021A5D1CE|nr:DUF3168 domain-containing protein [Phaeobacter inhibens]UWR77928.1 DUF3168 domain-containing protein [Phaeobacter inhibens]